MNKRIYTISTVLGFKDKPSLKMSGEWLKKQGFEIGDKLQLVEGKNMLIFIKIPKHKIEEQNKKYQINSLKEQLQILENKE